MCWQTAECQCGPAPAHRGKNSVTANPVKRKADFLGAAPANLAVSSNSGTLRLRQYYVNVEGRHESLGLWVGRTTRNRTLNFTHAGPETTDQLLGQYLKVRVSRGGPNSLAGQSVN